MKKTFLLILCLLQLSVSQAQSLYLEITTDKNQDQEVLKNYNYQKKHQSADQIDQAAQDVLHSLIKSGYLGAAITEHLKTSDSTFIYRFNPGNKTQWVFINIAGIAPEFKNHFNSTRDTIKIPVAEVEDYMQSKTNTLEKNGFSTTQLQLINHQFIKNNLYCDLISIGTTFRTLQEVTVMGYDKFPANVKKNWLRKYKNKVFNEELLNNLQNDINNLGFVTQTKKPEILLEQNKTTAFVYLDKSKINKFDGFVGFATAEDGNIKFNGNLDFVLNNSLNKGEQIRLNWINDGNKQSTLNVSTEIPYLFKSPVGLVFDLNIFKQDSTFQTTKQRYKLGYYFSYNSKLFVGADKNSSVKIQAAAGREYTNYESTFYNLTYYYNKRNTKHRLFADATVFQVELGTGKRTTTEQEEKQYSLQSKLEQLFYLNNANVIYVKNENFYLHSPNYIANELHRFGGANSLRGYNENSLQANLSALLSVEYRYILSDKLYMNTITDFAYLKDNTTNLTKNLGSLGFGLGLLNENSLLKINFANGIHNKSVINLNNSVIHLSY
ncbi:MAG: hypothetical protein KBS98_08455, partial [Flavobacterium sp.]|nr:hypothetical protein [Candidatus Neoflavobacterium equi]